MKTKKVYLLRNTDTQEVEYVGCSQNIKRRLYQHTKAKPGHSKGEGKFYGRTNLELVVVKEFTDKSEAYQYEGKLKLKYGFEWTEMNNIKLAHIANQVKIDLYEYKTKKYVGRFNSMQEACSKYNLHLGNLSYAMQGKRKHANGYYAISL